MTSLDTLRDKFDVIIVINGYNRLATYRNLMTPQGRFVMVGGKSLSQIMQVTAFGGRYSKKGEQRFVGLLAKTSAVDLEFIAQLVDESKIVPVIEKEVGFDEIPKALSELEKGHMGGKIDVWVNQD